MKAEGAVQPGGRGDNPPAPSRERSVTCRDPSGLDGHFQHAVSLLGEQRVRLFDLIQPVSMRDQRPEIDAAGCDHRHEPPDALLAAGAVLGQATCETRVAVSARRDRARDDSLTFFVT